MKKLFVILIFLILTLINPVIANENTTILDMQKNGDFFARITLYKYVLRDLKMSPKQAKEFANIDFNCVHAYKVDLNDDGKNEIIGYVSSTYFLGSAGYLLFILRNDSKYTNITLTNFEPLYPIIIIPTRTNGYKNIIFYGSNANNFKLYIIKYNGQAYNNTEQTEALHQYLKDFANYDISK